MNTQASDTDATSFRLPPELGGEVPPPTPGPVSLFFSPHPGWSLNPQETGSSHLRAEGELWWGDLQLRLAGSEKQQAELAAQLKATQLHNRQISGELQLVQKALAHTQQELAALRQSSAQLDNTLREQLVLTQERSQAQGRALSSLQGSMNRTQGELADMQGVLLATQREGQQLQQLHTRDMAGLRQAQIIQTEQTAQALEATSQLGTGLVLLCLLLLLAAGAACLLWYKKGRTFLQSLREQQLAAEQQKAEMLELITSHLAPAPAPAAESPAEPAAAPEPDHAPMLKFANEVARMEMNLLRMDASVKGCKQLSRGLERIRNNFAAAGYEMVPMLGQAWQEGMRADADFVADTSLPEGERRITAVSRPQVNYKGVLIQKASITVSQNI